MEYDARFEVNGSQKKSKFLKFEGSRCDRTDRLWTSMWPLPKDKAEIMSLWKKELPQHSLRSKRLEVVGARKNGTREGDTRGERERLPERPLARLVFLEPKYFQAPATLATSTKLTVVSCLPRSQ